MKLSMKADMVSSRAINGSFLVPLLSFSFCSSQSLQPVKSTVSIHLSTLEEITGRD